MFSGYNNKKRVNERYKIVGFISSGTYGRVYKAEGKNGRVGEFAIKKYDSSRQPASPLTNHPDSSLTRKASCSTRASPSPPFAKWHCAPSSRIQTLCILWR
jgi:cyclin-dependent kinase 8/11